MRALNCLVVSIVCATLLILGETLARGSLFERYGVLAPSCAREAAASGAGGASKLDPAAFRNNFFSADMIPLRSSPFFLLDGSGAPLSLRSTIDDAFSSLHSDAFRKRLDDCVAPHLASLPEPRQVDFRNRIFHAIPQQQLSRERVRIVPIGAAAASRACVVTSVRPADGDLYADRFRETVDTLARYNFSGRYINYGGFYPSPIGMEHLLLGVPYCVKIITVGDAYVSYGCEHLLWIDTSVRIVRNPAYLFRHIARAGVMIANNEFTEDAYPKLILPAALSSILLATGTDLTKARRHMPASVMGFHMADPRVFQFFRDMYHMAALGVPYLSCFLEEFPMSALLLREQFESAVRMSHFPLLDNGASCNDCFLLHHKLFA